MRKYGYLAYDLACICATLLIALYLRNGFPLIQEGKPNDLYSLLAVSVIASLCVLPLMRTHISMWRYTSMTELTNIMIAVALVVLLSNGGLFLISRLEMMPRSVPPMHWALAVFAMGGSRMLARRLLGTGGAGQGSTAKQHVVVVGACQTAELYLQFTKRILQHQVIIQGLVDSDPALTNRIFQKHKILGTPAMLPELIEKLYVHGIHVRQIVLAQLLEDLPPQDREILLSMQENGIVDLVHFAKHMGPQLQPHSKQKDHDFYHNVGSIAEEKFERPVGYYPYIKRCFDVVIGLAVVIILLPILCLTTLIVALDVGFPILFWQQRPGLYGKPFRLYKFRTMRAAGRRLNEDRLAHKTGDQLRTSVIGKNLRRLRLDELPQLIHIILGTMSFVGPRPLLPEDQPEHAELRLSVRPGVTGWAQIHGGDALTPQEKLLLDVWYIHHMSLWLDIRILFRTLLVVLKEDKPETTVIDQLKNASIAHE